MTVEPKTMTQEAFDILPEGQQQFYRALVEKGQFVIIPTPEPETSIKSEKPKEKLKHFPSPFSQFRDQPVEVILVCDTIVTGMLSQIWQYEIVITDPVGNKILVMKHAIAIVQATGGCL